MILAGIALLALVAAVITSIVGNGTKSGLFITSGAFAIGTYFNWKHDRNTTGQSTTAMRRIAILFTVSTVVLAACGGGSLTLTEYASETAALIKRVDSRLDAHADELFSSPASLEDTLAFLEDRVAGYHELVEGINDLNPPEQTTDLHAALQEILERLLETEEARLTFAETVTSVADLDQVWDGPEAQAVREAELEAITICFAAQAQVDATADREAFADIPWMPPEMREVVVAAFDCPE